MVDQQTSMINKLHMHCTNHGKRIERGVGKGGGCRRTLEANLPFSLPGEKGAASFLGPLELCLSSAKIKYFISARIFGEK